MLWPKRFRFPLDKALTTQAYDAILGRELVTADCGKKKVAELPHAAFRFAAPGGPQRGVREV